jgi:hypothetical protein
MGENDGCMYLEAIKAFLGVINAPFFASIAALKRRDLFKVLELELAKAR